MAAVTTIAIQAEAGPPPPPDAHLVAAARSGDRSAWNALFRRYAPVVHGVLLARVSPADADDLTQEVFIRAMDRLVDLESAAAFGGWLLTIARNTAASSVRGRREVAALEEARAARSELKLEVGEEARRALDAIRCLPDAYRETMILRLVEGLTGPQIAECTGLTHGSVRVNLHRGMQMLRDMLGERKP